jgi:hypothetical protein
METKYGFHCEHLLVAAAGGGLLGKQAKRNLILPGKKLTHFRPNPHEFVAAG